jgi:hypothetical protein
MADDVYRRVREARIAALAHLQRTRRDVESATVMMEAPRGFRRRRTEIVFDYTDFRAAFAPAIEEIKTEIRGQHAQTRAEIQATRADVLAAVKASPSQYVKLVCEFGGLFLLFSLAVRFILKIELVNTAFAVFMLCCLAVYWFMAHLKQRSEKVNDGRASA